MQIIILNQEFTCDNEMPAVEQVFQQLSQRLAETGQMIVCLVVDDVEVYEDYDQYITDHLTDIESIVVRVKTPRDLLSDSLLSVQEYLSRAVPEIDKLVDQFYHEVTSDTWNTFAQLLEGLKFIMDSLDAVVQHKNWYFNARQYILAKENLINKISMLQESAESQDRVWLSDVLLYEIIPVFKSLSMAIDASQNRANVH